MSDRLPNDGNRDTSRCDSVGDEISEHGAHHVEGSGSPGRVPNRCDECGFYCHDLGVGVRGLTAGSRQQSRSSDLRG
jgi:hypothetical protein